jgi:regulatory protein
MERARRSKGSPSEARKYALRLLSYRARSCSELVGRLQQKGFSREEAERTVGYLKDKGFIEDRDVARELLRYATERKHLGRRGIEMFLRRRGIDRDIISDILSSHTVDVDRVSAMKYVKRRLGALDSLPDETVKRRISAALRRRGFSAEVIRMAVNSLEA